MRQNVEQGPSAFLFPKECLSCYVFVPGSPKIPNKQRLEDARWSDLSPQILRSTEYAYRGYAVLLLDRWRKKKRMKQSCSATIAVAIGTEEFFLLRRRRLHHHHHLLSSFGGTRLCLSTVDMQVM